MTVKEITDKYKVTSRTLLNFRNEKMFLGIDFEYIEHGKINYLKSGLEMIKEKYKKREGNGKH